jgi:chromosome segregation ATPase
MNEVNDLYRDVYQIRAEMGQLNGLIERLDTTIERLTEVSTTISKLLAVQTNRLDHLEKMSSDLSNEVDENDKHIHTQIATVEKELYKEIEDHHLKIMSELKIMKEENQKQHASLSEKLAFVERWMWVVSGGAAVIGFILSKVTSKFF